ncbi:uncharacterized protein K489DRAFT_384632 [Dissoconium aciculare CBS 342.82]|uniref:Uncharacterized protein n=1 Tax=Dissoconium aciculare CBS 342.82 TaxID=1314786 RepID=A0A6J3LSE9_9PEZI|nr:uncharacterized protein K489DRAFT_384632 [Dissoconium aciculare CBS 342.82]KAF1818725.1 hypothetical protein K489DRAFT_384632 [Dissoconium aciculare CBS 342.82]
MQWRLAQAQAALRNNITFNGSRLYHNARQPPRQRQPEKLTTADWFDIDSEHEDLRDIDEERNVVKTTRAGSQNAESSQSLATEKALSKRVQTALQAHYESNVKSKKTFAPSESDIGLSRAGLNVLLAEWAAKFDPRENEPERKKESKTAKKGKKRNKNEEEIIKTETTEKSDLLITKESIQPLLNFLGWFSNLPEALNFRRTARWMSVRHPTAEAVQALLDLVLRKRPLSDETFKEITDILVDLLQCKHHDSITAPIRSYLDALPQNEHFCIILGRVIRNLYTRAPETLMSSVPPNIHLWLTILKSLQKPLNARTWHGQYISLVQRTDDLAMLHSYLAGLSNSQLAWTLLHGWVPRLIGAFEPPRRKAKLAENGGQSPAESAHDPTGRHSQHSDQHLNLMSQARTDLSDMRALASTNPGKYDLLVELLGLLHKWGLSKDIVRKRTREVLNLLCRLRTSSELKAFYDRVRDHPELGATPALRMQLIRHYISMDESYYAYHVVSHAPRLEFNRECYKLPLLMMEKEEISSVNVVGMLSKGRRQNKLKPSAPAGEWNYRTKSQGPQTVAEYVHMVHLVALAQAESPQLSDRQAFRRVWECYRFLVDSGIQPKSTIVRALITSGLIRTHRRTGRGLVLTKAKYIIDIIRQTEGDEEATLFVEKLQERLAENAVSEKTLREQLAREARQRAMSPVPPSTALLARKRQASAALRAKLRVEVRSEDGSLKRIDLPKSLVKLPDGSYLHETWTRQDVDHVAAHLTEHRQRPKPFTQRMRSKTISVRRIPTTKDISGAEKYALSNTQPTGEPLGESQIPSSSDKPPGVRTTSSTDSDSIMDSQDDNAAQTNPGPLRSRETSSLLDSSWRETSSSSTRERSELTTKPVLPGPVRRVCQDGARRPSGRRGRVVGVSQAGAPSGRRHRIRKIGR